MDNSNFLLNYQHLQYMIMYDRLINLDFASIAVNHKYDSTVFNHAFTSKVLDKKQLKKIEEELDELDRKPAVYFEKSPKMEANEALLLKEDYKFDWEDSWMFHHGLGLEEQYENAKIVSSVPDLDEFLKTFNACYQKDDPQNPYGELGDYIDVAKRVWINLSSSGKLQYFTIFSQDIPVAVASLSNFAGIGYISNVGSLREVRGQGFGKIATLFAVQQSVTNGNTHHCLATEAGQWPNEFYQRIGFTTDFTAVGFSKKGDD